MTDEQLRLVVVIAPLVSLFALAAYIALKSKPTGDLDDHLIDYLDIDAKVPKRNPEDED